MIKPTNIFIQEIKNQRNSLVYTFHTGFFVLIYLVFLLFFDARSNLCNMFVALFSRFSHCFVFLFIVVRVASARSVLHTAVPVGSTIALPCGWMKSAAGDAAANAATLEEADRAASELSWSFGRHGSKEIFIGFSAVVGGKWDSAKFDLLAKVSR